MTNEVTVRKGNYIANNADYLDAIAGEASTFREGGGLMFLKFNGNDGEYSYGSDDTELPLGSLLAANMMSYRRGWICWNDGKVVGEEMTAVHEGAPMRKQDLPDNGPYVEDNDGWSEQYTIELKMMDEPNLMLLFQANNASKRRAFEALMKDFARQYKSHPGAAPVIEIDEREFEAKGGKDSKRKYKKHAPLFKIVSWVDLEELDALSEGAEEDYEPEEPKTRASRRDEAPAGRRARDEEEERPARTRASRRDEEDEDDRGSSTRSSRAAADEDDEGGEPRQAPAGRRRSSF